MPFYLKWASSNLRVSMNIIHGIEELRGTLQQHRLENRTIGFVPTMGALHSGHLSLMKEARKACDILVASIFVNPTQFAPGEDFESYPRNLEQDAEQCGTVGVDYIFAPDSREMYPPETYIRFEIDNLTRNLCGHSRPTHFQGVLQVVSKLFNIVQPDVALFGQKDIQQYVLIETLVKEFNFNIRIMMGETVRDDDGLALSSRNNYLSKEERSIAPGLYRSLSDIHASIQDNPETWQAALGQQRKTLQEKGFRIDYISIVRYSNLQIPERLEKDEKYIIAGAVFLGETRLIDNILFKLN